MFTNFVELGIVCTNYCNSSCHFCYSDSLFSNVPVVFGKEERSRILNNAEKVVHVFSDLGDVSLGITGGEPSLVSYDVYDEIITRMSALNVRRMTFSTNGFFLNEPYLIWLRERNVDLVISYDGFIRYRNKKDLVKNIEFVSRFLPIERIYLHFLVYKFFDVDYVIKLMSEIDWLQFSYSFFIPIGRGRNLDLYFDEQKVLRFLDAVLSFGYERRFPELMVILDLVSKVINDRGLQESSYFFGGIWGNCWSSLRVDLLNGVVMVGDNCVGRVVNLDDLEGTKDLVLKAGISKIQKMKLDFRCINCDYWRICKGGCFLLREKYVCGGLRFIFDFIKKRYYNA